MATYYVTVSPIDALSTSTYSIYFDEIRLSNLMLSGVYLSELTGSKLIYFTGSAASATSVLVKNEDPDCCCAVKSFVLPTPSPTTSPTTAPTTAAPTTAAPTTSAPTTAAPTTAAPTTAAPTTPSPTVPPPVTECGTFSTFTKISGDGNLFNTTISAGSSGVGGTTVATGSITTTGNNCSISIRAFSGTGGSTSQGQVSVSTVGTVTTTTAGPGGGVYTTTSIVIPLAGTYDITLSGIFIGGTNPPTDANSVYLYIT
jgi:hypothetical protein